MSTSVTAALQQSPLGAGFSEAELIELAERLELVEIDADATLFEAGAPADAAYVLLQGELEIRAGDGTYLDTERPGALVGEQALMPGGAGARNAAVLATQPSRLLRVEAQLFHTLANAQADRLAQVEAASDHKTQNRLSRLSGPFAQLLAASERRTWTEGEVLFEEGDPADGLHVILAGQAEVVTERDGEPLHLSTVYPGRVFGEIATLRGVPRTATVIARAGLRTAFVPAAQALALQEEQPDLEAFLGSLLRSYELPRRGALHQRSIFKDGQACVETVYALGDGRELTALREASGRYTLTMAGAEVAKELTIAEGAVVQLDAQSRVVGLEDVGHYEDVAGLQALALDGEPLTRKQRRALRQAARRAAQFAPDAVICRCLNLERAALQAAIGAGADTADALQRATGCGTVCGGCMRKDVPALLERAAEGPTPRPLPPPKAPALPARVAAPLPRMPHLIPWLGNFSFSKDPAGFQRRGHARLGPIFGAHLMGVDFVFIDPVAAPKLADKVLQEPAEGLDAAGAWARLAEDRLGEALLGQPPALQVTGPSPAAEEAAEALFPPADEAPVELLSWAGEAVTEVLWALLDPPGLPPEGLGAQLSLIGSELTAFGALMPIETPAARRRAEARRALEAQLGAETLATLLAAHRNAQLAVVAAMLDLAAHPEHQDAVQSELDATPEGPQRLQQLPVLRRCLSESIRLRSGGAIWRLARREVQLQDAAVPAGALVGAVMELANHEGGADYDPSAGRSAAAGGGAGFFDEAFGGRASGLPERAATLVLARMLQGWRWEVVEAPARWVLPIVPGLGHPKGAARLLPRARAAAAK